MKQEREIDKLYRKYEYLTGIYARKVFNVSSISYEREDIEQEFKAKLFSAIVSYVKQFGKFLKGERGRPMLIEPYLRLTMSNFVVDFIKKMNQRKHNGWNQFISVERDEFDYSRGVLHDSNFEDIANFKISNFEEDKLYQINGVDLLHGLESREERIAFMLHLRGHKINIIDKVLKIKSGKVIKSQVERLLLRKEELFSNENFDLIVFNQEED